MSEFIAKIKAELDSKEVEQKLDELTKGKKKVKLEVDDSNIDNIAKKTDKLKQMYQAQKRLITYLKV